MTFNPEIFAGAHRLVYECAQVTSEDAILVITDTQCTRFGEAIMAACLSITKNVNMVTMPYYGRLHGQNPANPVAAAMKNATIIFMPTIWSMSHCSVRREASAKGIRCLTIPSADDELFARTFVTTPFADLKQPIMTLNQMLTEANEAHITTKAGTDMWVDLRGRRNYDLEHGWLHKGPEYANNFAAPPCVEANIAPIEYTARGRIVVDACQSAVGLIETPIELIVEEGRIVKISGGKEADELKLRLDEVGDPDICIIAELGIGGNPVAKMRGQFIEDESVYGTAHFGIGNNASTMGGKSTVNGHFDNIFWFPTITLDGVEIMKDGRFTSPHLPKMTGFYVS